MLLWAYMRPITRFLHPAGIVALLLVIWLSGCSMQAPIVIIVTPTHESNVTLPPVTPTAVPTHVAQVPSSTLPPATVGAVPTRVAQLPSPVVPSVTPTAVPTRAAQAQAPTALPTTPSAPVPPTA